MTAEGGGSQRTPLEALLVALRHSRAAHLTGSTVLRQVLGGSYRELWRDGGFDLAPVWDLLAAQPGFDPAEVMPALAKLKSWEGKLGKTVLLPPLMEHLTAAELSEMADSVDVPAGELAHVLRGGMVKTDHVDLMTDPQEQQQPRSDAPRPHRAGKESSPPVPAARAESEPARSRLTPRKRRVMTIGAGAIALVAFGFAGLTLFRSCEQRTWDPVALEFAGDIPLMRAERSGPEVAGTLRDPAWLKLPEAQRRSQMTAALRDLPAGVEVFFVRDKAGAIRGTARWFGGKPRQIAVTLR